MLLAGWLLLGLPELAEKTFGAPSENLDSLQRTYLSVYLLSHELDLTQPKDPLGAERHFVVPLGESTSAISNRLQSEGLIPNAETFVNYLVYSGLDTSIQAGEYLLNSHLTPLEIANALQDATPREITFRILPGWRIEEISETLPTSGINLSPEAFKTSVTFPTAKSTSMFDLPPGATLEGFLYPDSYRLPRDITVDNFIETLLDNYQMKVSAKIRQGFQDQGLNLFEAVTLASIVQREAVVEDEAPLIASVFLNRLAAGMKLESDPTVQYALGYNSDQGTWWTNPLSVEDLQINSPFNTYLYPGLPLGPISNPSLGMMSAIAFPEQTTYLYFRAACDGSGRHTFTETFEEHLANACPEE